MKSTSIKKQSSIEFKITYGQNDFEPARLRALERLARGIKIPGFRKGRAPANVVEQHVDPNELADAMLDTLIRQSIPKLIREADIDPISIPHVDVMKHVPGDSAEVIVKIDIMPDVKLPDYRKLKAKYPELKVKDSDVDDVLDRIASSYSETKVVKRAAKKGDQLIIDFKGLKDGEAFKGGSAKDYSLTIGSNMFIPGFEDGLIGHAAGDKLELPLTFPKEYHSEELAGQKVIFEVLVKQVNEVKKPKIDDELAKKADHKNLAELKKEVRKMLEEQNKAAADRQYADALLEDLVSRAKTSVPEGLLDEQTAQLRQEMEGRLEQNGATLDAYFAERGLKPEDYPAEIRKMAERRVKGEIVLRKVADEMNVKPDEAEVEKRLEEITRAYAERGLSEADKAQISMRLRHDLRMDKTIQTLLELNKKSTKK